jgi:hypothetical protein
MRYFIVSLLLVLMLPAGRLRAQAKPEDDFILRAMKDELTRSVTDLKLPGQGKPFFIMYGVSNLRSYSVSGTLGAIIHSDEEPYREKTTVRILVGDYEFNDESLEDDLNSSPTLRELALPIDSDYAGIRRSFWSTTDNVYRNAAKHFASHQETVAEMKKSIDDIPHRKFGRVPPSRIIADSVAFSFDRKGWEQKVKNLSSLFLDKPSIVNSAVMIQCVQGYQYLANTEGTMVRVPEQFVMFMAMARMKNDVDEFVSRQVFHVATRSEDLPLEQQLETEIKQMILNMENAEKAEKFDEDYSGPVLLMGDAVSNILTGSLLSQREGIMASDNVQRLKGYQYSDSESVLDMKIGKTITSIDMTVKAKPKLKSYNGVSLMGSYEIDNEGVVPPDELTIIEKGVLKTLLNNRTITHPSQTANGFASGPGVLEITFASKDTEKTLKEKLIKKAKEEGLDYAIIVREAGEAGSFAPQTVYKVSVADGSETLVRNARLGVSNLKALKKVMGASADYVVDNRSSLRMEQPLSVITPRCLLIEELDVNSFRTPSLKQDEYVPSPLVKK